MPKELVWTKHQPDVYANPVSDDAMVMVIFCNKERSMFPMKASAFNWECANHPYDVEFYSVVKP